MPCTLLIGDQVDFKVYLKTGAVPAGATFAGISSDPTNVTLVPEATPQPVANGEGSNLTPPVPDGTPSLISGTVAAVSPGTSLNPVTLTVTQTNPDGSTLVLTDTVTPSQTETLGDLFGTPVVAGQVSVSGKQFKRK